MAALALDMKSGPVLTGPPTAPLPVATKKGTLMPNLHQPPDSDPDRLDGPRITALFTALLEAEAARRGLPPDPWAP